MADTSTTSTDTSPIVPYALDEYFQSQPIGSLDKAIGNNLFGINHMQISGAIPANKDQYGLTFFTRPQLNLQAANLRNIRLFFPLLSDDSWSVQRFVRCTLDPRIQAGYTFNKNSIPAIPCSLVDNTQAFIPILTNNLNSISGWPDVVSPVHSSKPGLYNEVHAMVDGIVRNFETFDIEASFRNTRGDPIVYMFYIWLHYMSCVFEGTMIPYLDYIAENSLDYCTRIYRLVLDMNRNVVTKIAATGASFPASIPMGSFFDFNNEHPYNDQNKDISIRFKSMGAIYNDDILIRDFNASVIIFNPAMGDSNRERYYIKVGRADKNLFNNRGYPRINPSNYELEWWVDKDMYNRRTTAFLMQNLGTDPNTTDPGDVESDPSESISKQADSLVSKVQSKIPT